MTDQGIRCAVIESRPHRQASCADRANHGDVDNEQQYLDLLPWADPYIAALVHNLELSRSNIVQRRLNSCRAEVRPPLNLPTTKFDLPGRFTGCSRGI